METKSNWKANMPVTAFAVCIMISWMASFIFQDWLLPLVGIVAGLAVGDLMHAIFRPPEAPERKRIGKPR
jgi:hypothetical protein